MTRNLPWRVAAGRTADNQVVTQHQLNVLAELDKCGPRGTCAVRDVMDGGTLAALVQLGLAVRPVRSANDRISGCRYRISAAGEAFLVSHASAARTGGRR